MPFKNRATRKLLGLCIRCSRQALSGMSHCAHCLQKERERPTRPQNKATYRNWYYLRRYGLSLAEYERLFQAQGGKCAVCQTKTARTTRGRTDVLHVDHNHGSGQIRGLLCLRCNRAVGLLRDSAAVAQQLVNYLKRWL